MHELSALSILAAGGATQTQSDKTANYARRARYGSQMHAVAGSMCSIHIPCLPDTRSRKKKNSQRWVSLEHLTQDTERIAEGTLSKTHGLAFQYQAGWVGSVMELSTER